MTAQKPWTGAEDDFLRSRYADPSISTRDIAKILKRSRSGIQFRARLLGLNRSTYGAWSEKEIETLRQMWDEGISSREIGRLMKRGQMRVLDQARALGLPSRLKERKHKPSETEICKACLIKLEFAANCPVSKCPNFTGYVDPYERTLAGVSGGWVANG